MPFSNLFEELSLSGGHLLGGQAAVFDAAAVDSVWACSRLAAGAAQGQSAHWPSTASLLAVQEEALLPASRSDVMDTLRPHLRLLDGMAASSKVSERDISLLHNLVRHSRAMRTGETGFASGTSAIAIMSAMGPLGAHVAIDPFQPAYNRWGVRGAAAFAEVRSNLARTRLSHKQKTARTTRHRINSSRRSTPRRFGSRCSTPRHLTVHTATFPFRSSHLTMHTSPFTPHPSTPYPPHLNLHAAPSIPRPQHRPIHTAPFTPPDSHYPFTATRGGGAGPRGAALPARERNRRARSRVAAQAAPVLQPLV